MSTGRKWDCGRHWPFAQKINARQHRSTHITTDSLSSRTQAYQTVSTCLSSLDTDALLTLLASATIRRGGFGGTTARLNVNTVPVFLKLVPVSDLELAAGNRFSTANIFDLPLYYQYGIGSVGFGVWRELAAHTLVSDWVLSGRHAQFPLLYHSRIIPGCGDASTDTEAYVYLEHGAAIARDDPIIRRRLDAIRTANARVAMFIEHFPMTLSDWLREQLCTRDASVTDALAMIQRKSQEAFDFMRNENFAHFDAHFDNVLTDGRQLYFADFGLALHSSFDLGAEERNFLIDHAEYDRARFDSSMVHTLCRAIPGDGNWQTKTQALAQEPTMLDQAAIAAIRRRVLTANYLASLARKLIETDRHARFSQADACLPARFPFSHWSTQ